MKGKDRIAKTLTYRIGGTLITTLLIYGFTGEWKIATGIGLLDQLISSIWYYYHERLWENKRK